MCNSLQPGLLPAFWCWISRFGQAEVALPCVLAMVLWMSWSRVRYQAGVWLVLLSLAAVVTVATKLAFMGWGVGIASLDFTGISGHATLSAAIWPVLLSILAARLQPAWQRAALVCGIGMAFLVACSRLALGAHSPAEVLAGFLLGSLVSGVVLRRFPRPPAPRWLSLVLLLWLIVVPVHAPLPHAQGMISHLALRLSGHAQPFTRAHLRRQLQRVQSFQDRLFAD